MNTLYMDNTAVSALLGVHALPPGADLPRIRLHMCPRAVPASWLPRTSTAPLCTPLPSVLFAISPLTYFTLLLLTTHLLHSNGGREKKLAAEGTPSAIKDAVKAVAEVAKK